MKKSFVILFFIAIKATCFSQSILPKGAIVSATMYDTTRIGDSAWRYVNGWNYQFTVLKSTKKYPLGVWVPVGAVIRNTCKCNPKESRQKGFDSKL